MCLRNPFAHFISSMAALVVAAGVTLTGSNVAQQPPAEPGAPAEPQFPQTEPPAPTPPPRSAIDPHALRLVQRVGEHLDRSQSFGSRITYSFEVRGPAPGMREGEMTQRMTHDFAFQQPNLLRLELIDGPIGETIVSDGESMYIYLPRLNRYLQQDAPSDFRGLMEHPGAGVGAPGGLGGSVSFLGMILVPEMFDGLAQLLRSAAYLGVEEVDGQETHRVMLAIALPDIPPPGAPPDAPAPHDERSQNPMIEGANMQAPPDERPLPPPPIDGIAPAPRPLPQLVLELWIQEHEDNAVLRRMRIDLARLLEGHEAVPEELEALSIDVWIHLNQWVFDAEFSEEMFTFEPPEGAQRVETLREMIVVDGANADRHTLVGRPAPTFELQRLVGTGMDLSEHLEEDIVVLDFWATWCTPCVRAMPQLMSVAEEFRGQNVVFYFVNLREDFERVHRFVEDRAWEGRVMIPMDIDGRVAREYHVSAIPQTVIIGKDGIVQAVHVGFAPGMEERLRSEIQTLVDGGTLIDDGDEDGDNDE